MELHQVPRRQGRPGARSLLPDHEAREDHRRHRQGAGLLSTFARTTTAEAVVEATREEIWAILVDPDKIAALTPLVRSITDDGRGHWRWQLGGIDVLGSSLSPSFTVQMTFVEHERIDFTPDPPKGVEERAAVTGWYVLSDPPAGTSGVALATSLEIALELPLPGVARPAVESAMRRVVDGMGAQFSTNLLEELTRR